MLKLKHGVIKIPVVIQFGIHRRPAACPRDDDDGCQIVNAPYIFLNFFLLVSATSAVSHGTFSC